MDEDVYLTDFVGYKELISLITPIVINRDVLKEAVKLYDKYVMIRLCTDKIKLDSCHELWLPVEIWDAIVNIIKDDIESMSIYERNRNNEKLTLKLLDKYWKNELRKTNYIREKLRVKLTNRSTMFY